MKTLICTNCGEKIKFSQEEIEKLFDQCNDCYILKSNLLKTPKCPHCQLNLDEMTNIRFKEAK